MKLNLADHKKPQARGMIGLGQGFYFWDGRRVVSTLWSRYRLYVMVSTGLYRRKGTAQFANSLAYVGPVVLHATTLSNCLALQQWQMVRRGWSV